MNYHEFPEVRFCRSFKNENKLNTLKNAKGAIKIIIQNLMKIHQPHESYNRPFSVLHKHVTYY